MSEFMIPLAVIFISLALGGAVLFARRKKRAGGGSGDTSGPDRRERD